MNLRDVTVSFFDGEFTARVGTVAAYFYSRGVEDITLEETQQFIQSLEDLLTRLEAVEVEEGIQYEFYEVAKTTFGESRQEIRRYFQLIYQTMFERDNGPRLGQFTFLAGYARVRYLILSRMQNPLGLKGE